MRSFMIREKLQQTQAYLVLFLAVFFFFDKLNTRDDERSLYVVVRIDIHRANFHKKGLKFYLNKSELVSEK